MLTDLLGGQADALAPGSDAHPTDLERFAVFRAVAHSLQRLDRPMLVVLDDVQHAQRAALLLLRFLVGALVRSPLVLLITRRTEPPTDSQVAQLLDDLERDSTLIPLRPFDHRDTTAFLTANLTTAKPVLEPDVVQALLQATGGSPMFLAKAMAYGLHRPGPSTVLQAVGDALGRLPDTSRDTVAAAAVLGNGCSVAEVAALRDTPAAVILADLAAARDLVTVHRAGVSFDHELVRQAALSTLGSSALLDLHARAAQLLAPAGPARRVAHHALAGASRSTEDAALAISASLQAAADARRGLDYEAATDLLTAASEVSVHHFDARAHAEVLVELAHAQLASGYLTEARSAFGLAIDAAEAATDPLLVARAALGLGGVWVHEHRNPAGRARVLARQRAALAALPETAIALSARLRVRLAAEAVYEGGLVREVLDALDAARAVGDELVLAEALSLTHHALLAPEHLERRLALADELITAASAAGDGVLAVFGLLWRTVDLYEMGDPAAERALAELRERVDAFPVATVGYIVACIDVMRLIRAGRLADAEEAAGGCLERGLGIGDADATGYYGAQLVVIRWLQGREAELADLVMSTAGSATLAAPEYAFQILVGAVLARAGRLDEARAALAVPFAVGIDRLPRSSTWTSAMAAAIEVAQSLDDVPLANAAARLLEPFADRPVMPSLGVSCLGMAARLLGLAALTRGDLDAAVEWFERAVAGNDRIRHRPVAALSRADLADALVRRGLHADRERAATLFAAAATTAAGLDMPRRMREWNARAHALTPLVEPILLGRHASGWSMRAGGVDHRLPDLVGFGYLAALLALPGRDISAVELAAAIQTDDQPAIDDTALRAYRRRLREVDAEIAAADDDADLGRMEVLRSERDALLDELRTTVGLAGRVRRLSAPPERARTAVRKAIARALDVIVDRDAVLGAELRSGVVTGSVCRYEPPHGAVPWRVTGRGVGG